MKTIITEEMRTRQRAIEYAKKYNNNSKAAIKYHTTRQQIKRWRDKYDGTIASLFNKSRRPKSHPNQHTVEELELIYYFGGFLFVVRQYICDKIIKKIIRC